MKKHTEIVWITAGVGLVALWMLYERERNNTHTTVLAVPPEEDTQESEEDQFLDDLLLWHTVFDSYAPEQQKLAGSKQNRPFGKLQEDYQRFGAAHLYQYLQKKYETTQLTLTNTSDVVREVRLWAGNKKPPLSPLLPGEVSDHIFRTLTINSTQGVGIYPQGILVNPMNGYTYIANQLSNNISVLDERGTLIQFIDIPAYGSSSSPNPAYGWGPVDLTVNSQPSSPNFGKVYVANILADTISVINTQLEVETSIPVGKRPIAVAFNPVNTFVYVANIAADTVSVIDTTTLTVIRTIAVGKAPNAMTLAPNTGVVYVINSKDDSITSISETGTVIDTIENVGNGLTTAAFHPLNNTLYAVASATNEIKAVDLTTHTIRASIPVGTAPYRIVYNPMNTLLYIGNRGDDTYSIIDSTDQVIDTLELGAVGTGLGIDPNSDQLFSTNSTDGGIGLISYSRESKAVLINEEYASRREDFIYHPAIVKHVKFVFSGQERFNVLQLERETVTGTTDILPVSFSNYNSPQNFTNVAEVFEMNGTIIDGKHGWVFKIAAKQTITILTYYKQSQRGILDNIK